MNAFVKEVSITVYIQERIQGCGKRCVPPPLSLSMEGTIPLSLRIVYTKKVYVHIHIMYYDQIIKKIYIYNI